MLRPNYWDLIVPGCVPFVRLLGRLLDRLLAQSLAHLLEPVQVSVQLVPLVVVELAGVGPALGAEVELAGMLALALVR